MRTLTFTSIALGATLAATSAYAEDPANFATAGLLLSVPIGGTVDQVGLGVGASVMRYPNEENFIGGGGFLQVQYLLGGGWRADAGFQSAFWPVGAEVGVTLLSSRNRGFQVGLHLAPYLSVGYVTTSFRWTPLLSGGGRAFEITGAVNLWARFDDRGFGDLYDSDNCFFGCAIAGRPLMVDGRATVATPVTDASWSLDHSAPDAALTDAERAKLADEWTRDMLDEHASIAAFARLSLQLLALGAPPELIARSHQAALEEVDHARRCAALASRFAGRPVAPGALPEACAPVARVDLATMAADTLREGCLGEAVAAEVAARALAKATDAGVREALTVIARDEAEHARLAWDIVDWCVSAGGDPVRDALAEVLRTAPDVGARGDVTVGARLAPWGRADGRTRARSYTHRRREVMRRTAMPRGMAA